MPDQQYEHRVRYKKGTEPDAHAYVDGPRQAGEVYRQKRGEIDRSGLGGEVEIETRQVGPWTGVPEAKAVIPAPGEGS